MLTTIKGYYEQGKIILAEQAPTKDRTEVMVTFLTDSSQEDRNGIRKLGLLKGKISVPDDFNDQLEDFNE